MPANFILNQDNLSIDVSVNMSQNSIKNLPLPIANEDLANKQYVDEQIAHFANADQITATDPADPSKTETIQQILETLATDMKGYLSKSGGIMNAP